MWTPVCVSVSHQALPSRHPIVKSVSADRAAREAATGISPDELAAAGAITLLPHQDAAAATAATGDTDGAGSSRRTVTAAAAALPLLLQQDASAATAAAGDIDSSMHTDTDDTAAVPNGERMGAECARLAAGGGRGKKGLTFCSKNWVVQVDRHTGGCAHATKPCLAEFLCAALRDQKQLAIFLASWWGHTA